MTLQAIEQAFDTLGKAITLHHSKWYRDEVQAPMDMTMLPVCVYKTCVFLGVEGMGGFLHVA